MSCDDIRERLDDYVDGLLSEDEIEPLRRHLEDCEDCRREERELCSLLATAASLPGEETPGRDLWPGVEDRIGRGNIVRGLFGGGAWRSRRTWAAAAAALLIVVSTAVVSYRVGLRSGTTEPAVADARGSVVVLEAEFAEARQDLLSLLEQRKDSLAPDTLEMIEDNLRLIDQSLSEIRAALEKDPTNPDLTQLLVATHQREIDTLQRVNGWFSRL